MGFYGDKDNTWIVFIGEKKYLIFILVFYWSIAVCKCIGGCLVRDFQGIRAEYYKLLPMLCNHESNEIETHLAKDCIFTLGYMAQAILPLSVIPACLQAIHQVSKSGSWKARASVLGLLQVTMPYLNVHNGFRKIYIPTIFPHIVAAATILFWNFSDMALFNLCMKIKKKLGQMISFEVVNNSQI